MSDIGRLARSTAVAATMAERPGVSATAAESMQELVSRHGKLVDGEIGRLRTAAGAGTVAAPTRAVEALTEARAALTRAHVTISDLRAALNPGGRPPMSGVVDASAGSQALWNAASKLQVADRAVRTTEGVQVLSRSNSPYVLQGDEAARALATPHTPTAWDALSSGTREVLDQFKPRAQKAMLAMYRPVSKLAFGTNVSGGDNLVGSRHTTLGTIYVGSHHRQTDPAELVNALTKSGASPMRALAADGVMRDFSNIRVDGLAKRVGMFTVTNRTSSGEVVRAKHVMPEMLDQGQNLLVFGTGHLFPFPGIDGDFLSGVATAAVAKGAPIQHTATQGLQSKVDLGADASKGRAPLTMILDAVIPKQVPRDSPEFDEAVYQVTEILSQDREAYQRLVREMHLRQ